MERRDQCRSTPVEGSHTIIPSAVPAELTTEQEPNPADTDGFQLDTRIVETTPAAATPPASTDDDRSAAQGSDC